MKTQESTLLQRYTDAIIRWRWLVVLASVGLAIAALVGAKNIQFMTNYRVFFDAENPQLKAFDEIQYRYTKDDNVLFVLTPNDVDIYTKTTMEASQWLTAEAWKLPFATRVDSVTNFQHSEALEDDLFVDKLVPEEQAITSTTLEKARMVSQSEPLISGRLVRLDAQSVGVNVTMTFPEKAMDEVPIAAAAIRELKAAFAERYPDIAINTTGMVMLNNAFAESSMTDMATIIPLMYAGILVVMMLLLRSATGTFSTLGVIMLSSMTAIGLMGWLGINMTPPVSTAPTIIMTLAIADSIHILVTLLQEMRRGRSKREAIYESLRVNFQPVFLTSITTAIGFLSMNFSDAPPFRDLGNVVAMGVIAAWIWSITFLPAAVAILPMKVKVREEETRSGFDGLARFLSRYRMPMLLGSSAVVVGLGLLIPRLELNDQWVEYFAEGTEFRDEADYAMENLSGIYTMEFSLPAQDSGGISEPAYLQALERFTDWARTQPGVLHVNSLTDIMKRLNKNMNGDDPAFYSLADNRELSAQYLLLFEMSLPFGLDLNNIINVDKSSSRVIVTMENQSTRDLRNSIEAFNAWIAGNLPDWMQTEASSPSVMFAYISKNNIQSMLLGTFLAIVVISVILGVALRSAGFGLLSLVPNLVPAVLGFGLWSAFIGEMGLSLSVVSGMTLGIVVDDTVHFLSKYLRARREKGLDASAAVHYAFDSVGRAIVITTIVLVVGFSILSLSTFRLNSWMGQLTAVVITCALIADFLLLPALLLVIDRKKVPARDPQALPQPA